MPFSLTFAIDENIIEVNYNKDIKFFCQNFINVVLKYGQYVNQAKRHYLIFEIAVTGPENYFLFIISGKYFSQIGLL